MFQHETRVLDMREESLVKPQAMFQRNPKSDDFLGGREGKHGNVRSEIQKSGQP